jgi:DNA-directed RNA polymerase specialized sigma24 family protein
METAQMLGLAEGTCKAQLHRARKLLAERLNVTFRNTGAGQT